MSRGTDRRRRRRSRASRSRTCPHPTRSSTIQRPKVTCEKLVIAAGQWTPGTRGPDRRQRALGSPSSTQYLVTESPSRASTSDLPTLRRSRGPPHLTTRRRWARPRHGRLRARTRSPGPSPASPESFAHQLLDDGRGRIFSSRSMTLPWAACPPSRPPASSSSQRPPRASHPDGQLHPGRGARGEEPLRRRRLQTLLEIAARAAPEWRSRSGEWRRITALRPLAPSTSADSASTHRDTSWVRTRTHAGLCPAQHHGLAPGGDGPRGRPLRRAPLYDRLQAKVPCFGEEARLGARLTGRRAGRGAARTLTGFGRAELVRARTAASTGRRASAARPLRPSPPSPSSPPRRPRRRGRPLLDLRQRRDEAAGALTYTQMLNDKGQPVQNATSPPIAPLSQGTASIHHDRTGFAIPPRPGLDHPHHPERHGREALRVTGIAPPVLSLSSPPKGPAHPSRRTHVAPAPDLSKRPPSPSPQRPGDRPSPPCPVRARRVHHIVGEARLGACTGMPVEFAAQPLRCHHRGRPAAAASRLARRPRPSTRSGWRKAYRAWGSDIGP
jgi:4-methylaminobutanoate oxidase (formaldehyde-forming)